MGKKRNSPFSGNNNDHIKQADTPFDTFFVLKRSTKINESFHIVSPFIVEKAITANLGITKSTRKLRSRDLLIEIATRKQAQQIIQLKSLDTIPVTVRAHATLNSSKGLISCGELLHAPMEEVLKGFHPQGVTHVQRIKIRQNGQFADTKHLIFTFHSPKILDSVRSGYIKLTVRPYIPNPLRCYKCQRFGHSKASCNGTLTCARCTVVIALIAKVRTRLSLAPVLHGNLRRRKKLKKDSQVDKDNKTDKISQYCKTPQLSDKEQVYSLKFGKNSTRQVSNSVIKTSHTTVANDSTKSRVHSVDTELLPMAVLPPLEKIILLSRESDTDAEMSSSSASEGDTLEYDMSEDLEDTLENVCPTTPPPPSTARKR
ncbi:hypothetical protein AVEN_158961-1 [Araneus ventricosus]|uniref:CCHC-type domain-containing protein n=1 Tax=Araneus ventricosus TaxID=182803 RepID=A0A4Y2B8Z8_ARAVE|nr:hypothetical protein AVEN_158961-1 [Araneus ventricosus]